MHFWIDKRSQACGFNGRHGVPASIASGIRRNKPMVTPVHRFQSIESAMLAQQLRRPYQQQVSQPRPGTHQTTQCNSSPIHSEPTISRTTQPELDTSVYLDAPLEGSVDTSQGVWPPAFTKYGMWASFGLTVISLAATKVYVENQGTLEMLLFCTLSVLSALILFSCVFSCKKKRPEEFTSIQATQTQPAVEMELPELMPQRDMIITPLNSIIQAQIEPRSPLEVELPPPPYDIAILLPMKENCADTPPPTYENAMR